MFSAELVARIENRKRLWSENIVTVAILKWTCAVPGYCEMFLARPFPSR